MISISGLSDGVLVALHGDVNPELLDQVLTDVTDDDTNAHVVIDLREAAELDHDGVVAISDASERVSRRRGRLILCSPHRSVRYALEREGLEIEPA